MRTLMRAELPQNRRRLSGSACSRPTFTLGKITATAPSACLKLGPGRAAIFFVEPAPLAQWHFLWGNPAGTGWREAISGPDAGLFQPILRKAGAACLCTKMGFVQARSLVE